jgi:hypothetical protein
MRTGLGLGIAAFLLAGLVIWLPGRTGAQSLAGQAAAAGIQGDLASRSQTNALGAAQRARARLAAAQDRGREADEFSSEALAGSQRVPSEESLALQDYVSKHVGKVVPVEGEVFMNMQFMNLNMAFLRPAERYGMPDDFVFFLLSKQEVPVGSKVKTDARLAAAKRHEVNGLFGLLFVDPKTPLESGALDRLPVDALPSAPQPPALPAAPEPAPEGFIAGVDGWRLAGVVDIERGTCLFVDDRGEPAFLRPGEQLQAGVYLKSVDGSNVVMQVKGKDLAVAAW